MLTTARHVVDIALSHSKMVISWKFQSDWQHQHRQNAHTNTHEYVDCNLLVFFREFSDRSCFANCYFPRSA